MRAGIHSQVRVETSTQHVACDGPSLCRDFAFGLFGSRQMPRMRNKYVPVFSLDAEEVAAHFIELVDKAVEGSLRCARGWGLWVRAASG